MLVEDQFDKAETIVLWKVQEEAKQAKSDTSCHQRHLTHHGLKFRTGCCQSTRIADLFVNSQELTASIGADEKSNVVTASLTDAVLDEKAKTIVFPEVPNIFGVLPLFISSKDVPLTYHYELNGDILTIYAEKTFEETGAHLVYPMKFKKVQN